MLTELTTAGKFGVLALGLSAFWSGYWASIPQIGVLNVGVSCYLAFRVALRTYSVSRADRKQIYRPVRQRHAPLGFFLCRRGRVLDYGWFNTLAAECAC